MTARGTHPFGLSDREVEILGLVAEGLSNVAIGERLWLSPATAKSHLHRIGKKLDCGERGGMVAIAYRTGLLRIPDAELLRQAAELAQRMRGQEAAA